jgi:hypothetical protein
LDERAEQRDERRALNARIRDYQQAKRLVDREPIQIAVDLSLLLQVRAIPENLPGNPSQDVFLPTTAWEQYKEELALEITEQQWRRISGVYVYTRGMRFQISRYRSGKALSRRANYAPRCQICQPPKVA